MNKSVNDDYWVDLRDLFMYGDQFVNYTMTPGTTPGTLSLPTADVGRRYAVSAEIDLLFAAASPANKLFTDGVVNIDILGRQQDRTPGQKV